MLATDSYIEKYMLYKAQKSVFQILKACFDVEITDSEKIS
jgi:hypothetical protein